MSVLLARQTEKDYRDNNDCYGGRDHRDFKGGGQTGFTKCLVGCAGKGQNQKKERRRFQFNKSNQFLALFPAAPLERCI